VVYTVDSAAAASRLPITSYVQEGLVLLQYDTSREMRQHNTKNKRFELASGPAKREGAHPT